MRIFRGLICVLAMCLAGLGHADDRVDELMIKSGAERQVAAIPEMVLSSFQERFAQDDHLSEQEKASIMAKVASSFKAEILQTTVKQYMRAGLGDEDIVTILEWLSSPLGVRITQMEEVASTPEGYDQMMAYVTALEDSPAPQERVDAISDLDTAARMTGAMVDIQFAVTKAMMTSIGQASGQGDAAQNITAQMEANRGMFETQNKQNVMMIGLFTYKDLTIDEIKQYADFYRTPAGQKYQQVVTKALATAVADASEDLGRQMAELLKQRSSAGKS